MKNPYLVYSTVLLGVWMTFLCIPRNSNAAVTSSELQALTDMYNTMNGPNWQNRANWPNGDPCSSAWARVTCTGGSVTSLDLSYNSLTGPFPSSFSGLQSLTSIWAYGNRISGTVTSIFNLIPPLLNLL